VKRGRGRVRLVAIAAIAPLAALVVPVVAVGEPDGPKLAFVGSRPVKGDIENGVADFGVTVRNDSDFGGRLDVRLVLDSGSEVPVDPSGVQAKVGDEEVRLSLAATPSPLSVRARDAARVALHLSAAPVPKRPIVGTVVIAARRNVHVTPLTVRMILAKPAAAVAAPRFDKVRVKPSAITMVVRRGWPSFIPGSGDDGALFDHTQKVAVTGIAVGARTTATSLDVDVASDTGGRGTLRVSTPAIGATASTSTISVNPKELPRYGTYDAAIPLDEASETAPTLTVKVIAGDLWVWPVVTLVLGAFVAYLVVRLGQMIRPRRVLQLALTRAQARNNANVVAANGLACPYSLAGLFPTGGWDCTAAPTPDALALFCAIEKAKSQEELDALATQVADVEARVNAWLSVCAKADALRHARDELAKHHEAGAMVAASDALGHPEGNAIPRDAATTSAYMQQLDDQVIAAREWLAADALLEEGLGLWDRLDEPPPDHDPARWRPDLRAARSLADLERCRVVAGLCRDVHVLRSLVFADRPARSIMERRQEPLRAAEADAAAAPALPFATIAAAPPALPGPALTSYLVRSIRVTDWVVFGFTTAVAGIAYLAGIYSDTWGSPIDYLTAFAAGAGTTFVANWKLLPWYSSTKPPSAATPAAAA
jgi:hypothetical protein